MTSRPLLHLLHTTMPSLISPSTEDRPLASMLVQANHILVAKSVLDAYGHVSVRHPTRPDVFFLSRSLAPASVQIEDILAYDLSGNPLEEGAPRGYIERFIHSEIYRARPDVQAIVHSHSLSMVAFAGARTRLQPMYHMGACVADHTVFDIRQHLGDTDMLVKDETAGRYLAATLGSARVVLMRGHGSTTVGESLPETVFRAVYAETNASIQIKASALGPIEPLNSGEVAQCLISQRRDAQRAWDVWCEEIK